ncbi:MAG: ABC transporter permease, partial [Clostridia bacterium]
RQVVAGTQSVLEIAFYTALFTVAIGTVLGILSGFVGGILDKIIMSITNIFLSIPSFPVLLLLAAIFTIEKPMEFAIILSVWGWAGLCRAIRVQVTSLKERDFIQICTVMHMSKPHIIFRELMPNLLSYVVINFVMSMRNAIMGSVGLMIIGLGNYDPTNWGAMINAAKSKGLINPDNIKILLYPLILIIIFQVAALLFANGLDETLNPRLKVQ